MKWEIKYYLTEVAYKSGVAAYKEIIQGTRDYVITWATNKCKSSNFVTYDICQK